MVTTPQDFEAYKFIKQLGTGSFGEVWLVDDKKRHEKVALKFLRIDKGQEAYLRLFKQEFALLSELRHTHLARVFDFGFSPNKERYYFTEEFCPGKNLLEAVQDKPLSYFEEVLVQILSALDYVHSIGIAHFDIKADNILVDERDDHPHVKILDFGVAAKLKTLPKIVGGSLAYMSPELVARNSKLDHRVDLYSLGMLCLRALTGQFPFGRQDKEGVMQWHLQGRIPQAIWKDKEIPRYCREIIEKLLEKRPVDRFSNARVVLRFLNVATGNKYRAAEKSLQGKLPVEGPLVGREKILESLEKRLQSSLFSKTPKPVSVVCFISGGQGMGKSRILDEIRRAVELKEIRLIHLVCDRKVPVWPQLAEQFELQSLTSDELNEEWQVQRRVDAVLQEVREQPLCLLIDDFHKADRDMMLFIERLATRTKKDHAANRSVPLFALIATEEEREGGLSLARLNIDEVTRYANLVLGPIDRIETTAELLHKYSGGLPLLMVEGLRFMAPHIYRDEPLENLLPPPQIGTLYGERIRALKAQEKKLLFIVALLFRPARMEELINILEMSQEDLFCLAEACRWQGLLEITSSSTDRQENYQVSNQALALDLIRQLESKQRQSLHRKIAMGLEKTEGVPLSEIGFHMVTGGKLTQGKDYYKEAGLRRRQAGQIALAAEHWKHAIDLAEEGSPEWSELIEEVSELLILMGAYQEAKAYLKKLRRTTAYRPEELRGWLAFKQRQFSSARESYQRAMKFVPEENLLERILIENSLANVDLQEGNITDALKRFRKTFKLENSLPPDEARKINNNKLGLALSLRGNVDESIRFYEERMKRLAPDQTTDKISILNDMGYVLMRASRFDEAISYLNRAREVAEKSGAMHSLFSILGNLTTALSKEARYAESLHQLEKVISLQERLGSTRDASYNLLRQGSTYLILGMEEAARECFKRGQEMAREISEAALDNWFLLMEGYREREFGAIKHARELFHQVENEAHSREDKELLAWAYYALADLAAEQGDWQECQQQLRHVPGHFGDEEFVTRRRLLDAKLKASSKLTKSAQEFFGPLEAACLENHLLEILWEVYHSWGRAELECGRRETALSFFKRGITVLHSITEKMPEEYRDRYLKQRARQALYNDWKQLERPQEIILEEPQIAERGQESPPSKDATSTMTTPIKRVVKEDSKT